MLIFFIINCSNADGRPPEDSSPHAEDLSIEFYSPVHRRAKAIVGAINSCYYNLIDKKVRDIRFNFKLAEKKDDPELLNQREGFDIAKKIEEMDIFITCYPLRDSVDVSVVNKPFFDNEQLDRHVAGFVEAIEEIAKEFLKAWKRYVTRLIDPRFNHVKSLINRKDEIIIELMDRGAMEYRLVFDPTYKLKFWEAFYPFESGYCYRETPQFAMYDSKYLIKTLYAENFGRFTITYQSVNGIQVPKEVVFYSELPDVPDTTMLFTNVEVRLYE